MRNELGQFKKGHIVIKEWKEKSSLANKKKLSWNKDIPMSEDIKRKIGEANKGHIAWNKGKKLSPLSKEHKEKLSNTLKGKFLREKSSHWTGENGGYSTKHKWLSSHYQKKGICEICGKKIKTEWANIDGKYLRREDNYLELCRKCHVRFDIKNGIKFGRYKNNAK